MVSLSHSILSILEYKEDVLQLTKLLRADNLALILQVVLLNYYVFSGNGAQIFGCICGAMPNKDVSIFLLMLRSSSVYDTFMPL